MKWIVFYNRVFSHPDRPDDDIIDDDDALDRWLTEQNNKQRYSKLNAGSNPNRKTTKEVFSLDG